MRASLVLLGLLTATPASAQVSVAQVDADEQPAPQPLPPLHPTQPGRVADSTAGTVGQRQTRQDAGGIAPMARLSSRMQTRVQSRLRNRIDQTYDPQANATDPFAVAEDQTRTAGGRR